MELSNPLSKVFGWFLLFLGLAIVIWPLYFSYQIFLGKAETPNIFKITSQALSNLPANNQLSATTPAELQKQIEGLVSNQIKDILPVDLINKFFNLAGWMIVAGILIFGGSQIANLGVNLLKK